MNWKIFLKNRLELNLSYLEFVMCEDDTLAEFISITNEESVRAEIIRLLNTNYSDLDLYDWKNKLEMIIMLKDYNQQKQGLINYSEPDLVEKLLQIESHILIQNQYIEDMVNNLSKFKDLGLIEISFRDLRRDYQNLYVYKQLKRSILQSLKDKGSALAQLAFIFSDF